MNLNQLTDTQLIQKINVLGEEILATGDDHPAFDEICDQYDAAREELDSRGLW